MIGSFPDPYPDELAYSILARYYERMKYPRKPKDNNPYLRKNAQFINVYFPCHIPELVWDLPSGHPLTINRMVFDHSFFPYFGTFEKKEKYLWIKESMMVGRPIGSCNRMLLRCNPASRLRYCPICLKEDAKNFGEAYWHRVHQCPGVQICHKHLVWIENSDLELTKGSVALLEYYTANTYLRERKYRLVPQNNKYFLGRILNLVIDSEWILGNNNNYDPLFIFERLQCCLFERGFISISGSLNELRLRSHFEKYLRNISTVNDNDIVTETEKLFNRTQDRIGQEMIGSRTFDIIRIVNSLGYNLKELIGMKGKYCYDQPYPCINPICVNYQKQIINECLITKKGDEGQKNTATIICPKCHTNYLLEDDNYTYHNIFPRISRYIEIKKRSHTSSTLRKKGHILLVPQYNNTCADEEEVIMYIRKHNQIRKLKKLVLRNYYRESWKVRDTARIRFLVMLYYGIKRSEVDYIHDHYYGWTSVEDMLRNRFSQKRMDMAIIEMKRRYQQMDRVSSKYIYYYWGGTRKLMTSLSRTDKLSTLP